MKQGVMPGTQPKNSKEYQDIPDSIHLYYVVRVTLLMQLLECSVSSLSKRLIS